MQNLDELIDLTVPDKIRLDKELDLEDSICKFRVMMCCGLYIWFRSQKIVLFIFPPLGYICCNLFKKEIYGVRMLAENS